MQPTRTLRCYVCGEEKARGTEYFGAQRICRECKRLEQRSPYQHDPGAWRLSTRPAPQLRGKCLIAGCLAPPLPGDAVCEEHAHLFRESRAARGLCFGCGGQLGGAIAGARGTCYACHAEAGVSGATLAAVCKALGEPLPVGVAVPA